VTLLLDGLVRGGLDGCPDIVNPVADARLLPDESPGLPGAESVEGFRRQRAVLDQLQRVERRVDALPSPA